MRIISLGWGVQSWGLAAMSALGVLPPVDAAIHADTGHERAETYAFAAKWTPWLGARGVRVVTTKAPDTRVMPPSGLMLPAYLRHNGKPSGLTRRICTRQWKIRPVRRYIASELKRFGLKKSPGIAVQWMGITLDEIERMRASSGVKYIENGYPFIEQLGQPWTRIKVMQWLQKNNLDIPVKSSCIVCPYRDRQGWRDIQIADNGDWEKAIIIDEAIRHDRHGYTCYLTSERKPLAECDFRSQQEHGQLELWSEECSGMCFL